jgi:soluble lytic murein transglycosylase-like protein
MGIMQLMPGTASALGVADAFDPRQNIMGGAKYLSQLLARFDGDVRLAVAAYNAGPNNGRQTRRRTALLRKPKIM